MSVMPCRLSTADTSVVAHQETGLFM